jgi:hypothetical protein
MIYFSHIPKTAGSSFYRFLEDQFDLNLIFQKSHTEETINAINSNIKFQLIRGHFPSHKIFNLEKNYKLLTMLRAPNARYSSQINHNLRLGFHSSEYTSANLMTKWIARDALFPLDFNQLDKFSDDLIFEIAAKHLNNMHWVGITENYYDSICSLAIMEGWWPTGINYFENVSPNLVSDILEVSDKENFFNINDLDVKLYEEAKHINKILISKAREFAEDLISKNMYLLERLKWLDDTYCVNNLNNTSLEDLAKLVFLKKNEVNNIYEDTVSINASSSFAGIGWHRREYSEGIKSYRWSGPQTNSIILINSLICGTIFLSVKINAWHLELLIESIIVKINNVKLKVNVIYDDISGCSLACTGFVPSAFNNIMKISFEIPKTLNINKYNTDDDNRPVGFSFTDIYITKI